MGDDFDVAYSLTLVRTDKNPLHPKDNELEAMSTKSGAHVARGDIGKNNSNGRRLFASMACTYVIAAAGPAMPDVRAEPFNAATCMWEREDGVGENYQVDFSADAEEVLV